MSLSINLFVGKLFSGKGTLLNMMVWNIMYIYFRINPTRREQIFNKIELKELS